MNELQLGRVQHAGPLEGEPDCVSGIVGSDSVCCTNNLNQFSMLATWSPLDTTCAVWVTGVDGVVA